MEWYIWCLLTCRSVLRLRACVRVVYVRVCVTMCARTHVCALGCVVVADAKDNEFSKGEKDIEDALELVREHPTISRLRAAACHALQCSV